MGSRKSPLPGCNELTSPLVEPMTLPKTDDRDVKHLKNTLARMTADEVKIFNQQALATLLFIYSTGENEYSDQTIRDYPALKDKNRIMHWHMRNYLVLDLLRCSGYIEGESNRQARWNKTFLTDKGLEKAKQLHEGFVSSNHETIVNF
jgi:hypothetical protein